MKGHLQKTDAELLAGMINNDVLAFTELYKRYSGKMYVNIYKMVKDSLIVEEIIQVLFFKIWNQRNNLNHDCDIAGYIYRSASNLVCDFYRREKKERILIDQMKFAAKEEYTHIEEDIFFKESEELVQKALTILSPQQRNVFQLCKLEGYTYKETASQLGISPFTVKEYLCKAKSSVKVYLSSHLETIIN